jgi:hypothetical protein
VLEFARGLREAAEGASTQVVRRRKIEAAAARASKEPRKDKDKVLEQVSPFFNPVQVQLAEGFRPGRLLGWRGKLARMIPPLPASVPARVGLAMALLFGAFGVSWLALRRPGERRAELPPALAAAPAHAPAIAPIVREPTAEPSPGSTATPTAAVMTARVAPEVEPIVERPPPAAAAPDPPPPVLAVKRARSAHATHGGASAAAAAAATADTRPAGAGAGAGACALALKSSPWAHVWLDGKDTGRRTPVAEFHVPCGDHKLVLKRDDLDIYQMEVITVRAGTTFRKSYPLK